MLVALALGIFRILDQLESVEIVFEMIGKRCRGVSSLSTYIIKSYTKVASRQCKQQSSDNSNMYNRVELVKATICL